MHSDTIEWLSVHQVTNLYHSFKNSSAITCALISACFAYSLKSLDSTSFNATVIPAIVFIWGQPCIHGNTARSILVGRFSIVSSGFFSGFDTIHLLRIIDHLGQRRDL